MKGRIIVLAATLSALAAGQAAAQINGSPHDLATGVSDNNEICVYCHTPHGAQSQAAIEAPLWNKPSTGSTYTTYDSTTIDGDVLAVGSVSVACLTCHDGTQAMDSVLNAPGSGAGAPDANGDILIGNGQTIQAGIALLGTDLTNDHPIGIQYGGFDPGTGQIDPDFVNNATVTATTGLNSGVINGATRWWVNTGAVGGTIGRDKTDMVLYTRDNAGSPQPFVECATCHDPHEGGGTVSFMRIQNTDSDVCLACHVK